MTVRVFRTTAPIPGVNSLGKMLKGLGLSVMYLPVEKEMARRTGHTELATPEKKEGAISTPIFRKSDRRI